MSSTTHFKTADHHIHDRLHISHVYDQISAWEPCPENFKLMEDSLQECLKEARETGKSVMWDHDGLMHLVITPNGYIKLCCPIATYQMADAVEPYAQR